MDNRKFNRLALRLFEWQKRFNSVYARFCVQQGGGAVKRWQDIPALPVSAFKHHRVACFPKGQTRRVFMTSGTTRGALRGKHEFKALRHYDAAIRTHFEACVLPDLKPREKIAMVFLVERTAERSESSLCYMGGRVLRYFGSDRPFYALKRGTADWAGLTAHLRKLEAARCKALIFSTTFALADYCDFLSEKKISLCLPAGSRVMETGGFKGRRTEVARPELVKRVGRLLGVPAQRIINEYGMTELSSQFYDLSIRRAKPTSVKGIPPWTRVLIVDPRTGRPVAKGRRGMIRVIDLANEGSCLAVQTEDEGRIVPGGFEILGRRTDADLRGCSLTFEEMKGLSA